MRRIGNVFEGMTNRFNISLLCDFKLCMVWHISVLGVID